MQVLIHLPEDLASRFRRSIPSRQRSGFIRGLLEKSLPDPDEALFQLALKVEKDDAAHPEELATWNTVASDGLDPNETFDTTKLSLLCQK